MIILYSIMGWGGVVYIEGVSISKLGRNSQTRKYGKQMEL